MKPFISDTAKLITEYTGLSELAQVKLLQTLLAGIFLSFFLLFIRRIIGWRIAAPQRRYLANKTAGYTIGLIFTLIIWRIWIGGGLVAYIGIVSAGLAIALKDPITNLAGWLFISIRKPFAVGDRIEINATKGDVIDQRLFAFSLVEIGNWVDADQSTGRIIHIPNGWIFIYAIANYTQGFNFIWNELPVLITFESDWPLAKTILGEIATKHSAIKSEYADQQVRKAAEKYLIHFEHLTPIVWTSVKDSGIMLTIRYLSEPRRRRGTASIIWEDILNEFAKHPEIQLAYPTQRFYTAPSAGSSSKGAEGLLDPVIDQ